MKFITAFLTMLMAGPMRGAARSPFRSDSKMSRLRTPGNRRHSGAKLQRMFKEKMATKRGRRANYEFKFTRFTFRA